MDIFASSPRISGIRKKISSLEVIFKSDSTKVLPSEAESDRFGDIVKLVFSERLDHSPVSMLSDPEEDDPVMEISFIMHGASSAPVTNLMQVSAWRNDKVHGEEEALIGEAYKRSN